MSKERTGCEARVVGDEWHCGRCGLQWDVNDDDPPRCGQADPPDDPLAEARAILNR